MATTFTYRRGGELPGLVLPWQTETSAGVWADIDFSSGWTFTLTLTDPSGTATLTKTTNITGGVGSVTVAWAANELDIEPGNYRLNLRARETASSKDRDYSPDSPVRILITA